MSQPLVSVVCLCFNQANNVEEAMQSVLDQTYPSIELIVVDDSSTDDSVSTIDSFIKRHSHILFIKLEKNVGNCAAFNIGYSNSKGDYIIDLAADDVLMPNRVEKGIMLFEKMGSELGVQFSDAQLIDSEGRAQGLHSQKYPHARIPQGDIYLEIIRRYFICSPTMLIRREVIEKLNGYDESLAYEDFDFWIRSSRLYNYLYLPEVLMKRRVLPTSMSRYQFRRGSSQLRSTFKVCEKIKKLNKTRDEDIALNKRIKYEISVCLRLLEFRLALSYVRLLQRST
jgi:glycosyltransferase involved in cell wall biosynthesis